MTRVDYRQLFEHIPALVLTYDPDDHQRPFHLHDRTSGQLFARISTLPQADAFLRALERKGDATVDWTQVGRLRSLAASLDILGALQGSGEVPTAERRPAGFSVPQANAGHVEPATSPDTFSRAALADVIPLPVKGA